MILRGIFRDDFSAIACVFKYRPYRIDGNVNPDANSVTWLILDLKDVHSRNHDVALKKCFTVLNPNIERGVVITVVPSHDPSKLVSGIRQLATELARHGRVDGTGCLLRYRKVDKKSGGGSRDANIDMTSIRVEQPHIIKGKPVLLMDDVTTTGNSLFACKELLMRAGALCVQRLALAKTVR